MNKIITFYSYKGGVGRSMALANVATMMSHWGLKVLILDWDLEAPGLENFFKSYLDVKKVEKKDGVIDLLSNRIKINRIDEWRDLVTPFSTSISKEPIHFISSGRKDDNYFDKLNNLNIEQFYLMQNGGEIIEALRNQWKSEYDFILIDSRTGVTGIGGICTIQLPDYLVLFFTPTDHGLKGTIDVAKRAMEAQKTLPFDREALISFPVPTRIDYQTEFKITQEWIERFSIELQGLYNDILPSKIKIKDFIEQIKIPYISFFSYGEDLPVIVQGTNDPAGLGYAYENLTSIITNNFESILQFNKSRDQYIDSIKESIVAQRNERVHKFKKEKEVTSLYEAKLIVLGESGAGKTSLVQKLINPDASIQNKTKVTQGINISNFHFSTSDGNKFKVHIWDFGGQQIYHALHELFMTENSLYVLVDDARNDDVSIVDISFHYWIQTINLMSPKSPILIIQNEKFDKQQPINETGLKRIFNNVKGVLSINLYKSENLPKIRQAIKNEIQKLPHVGSQIPAQWSNIKNKLQSLSEFKDYIFIDEYYKICREHNIAGQNRALLLSTYLHELGLCLHFQNDQTLKNVLVINFRWITDSVLTLINSPKVIENNGQFYTNSLNNILGDSRSRDQYSILIDVLKYFQLCYQSDTEEESWILPQLLPVSAPDYDWNFVKNLILRLRYEFMPSSILSKFIVKMHNYIKSIDYTWRDGSLLKRGSTIALVEQSHINNEISIRIKGKKAKEFMTIITNTFDNIHSSYGDNLKVEKLIPCNCSTCSGLANPNFYEKSNLERRIARGRNIIECPISFDSVEVDTLTSRVFTDKINDVDTEEEAKSNINIKSIELFVTGSKELAKDIQNLEIFIRRENKTLINQGIFINLNIWEDYIDTTSRSRLQDQFNEVISNADIFISLFGLKIGKYTREEFHTLYRDFINNNKLGYFFTFFKNTTVDLSSVDFKALSTLKEFRSELNELGNYSMNYSSSNDLNIKIKAQLNKLIKNIIS